MASVDVIVPCYLYGHYLRQCVESVLAQPLRDVRVLIVDDASPDETSEVAEALSAEDPRIVVRRHSTNVGHIDTYNEGIAWASAKYMLILSADDYLLPGSLAESVAFMDRHDRVGFTFGGAIEWMEGTEPPPNSAQRGGTWRLLSGAEYVQLSGARNIVRTPTAVVRTEVQRRVGGYRRDLPHTGDMEMWLRFAAHGSIGAYDGAQAVYRRHARNMSAAYMVTGWLPDLTQRKAAIERFASAYPDSELAKAACPVMLRALSREAVGFARTAVERGQPSVAADLADLAVALDPHVRRSVAWAKLVCLRRLGPDSWRRARRLYRSAIGRPDPQVAQRSAS